MATGFLRSDAVLEKTQKLAREFEFNDEQIDGEQQHQIGIRQKQDQNQSKWAALDYAHKIAVVEKKFKTLNDSAEKLFEIMATLCIDLLASNHLKEVMYQYRNMCTNSSKPSAFNELIKQIVNQCSSLVDNLENKQNSYLQFHQMGNITNLAFADENNYDQSIIQCQERRVFYRETLKNILEVTRKLESYEGEYHSICARLINFCVNSNQKDELKRVCSTIKNHVAQIINADEEAKHGVVYNRSIKMVSFNNSKTLQLNLQTRMLVFDACFKCNLWREAFFVLEELNDLISMKSMLKLNAAKVWFDFYRQIAQICLASTAFDSEATFSIYQKFAAFAYLKAFEIVDKAKGPSDSLKSQIAISAFLCSISISEKISNSTSSSSNSAYFGRDSVEKLKKLLKIQNQSHLCKDSVFNKAFTSHLLQYIPEDLKKLGFLLKEDDSMPEELLSSLHNTLEYLKGQPEQNSLIQRLIDSVSIYNLGIVSKIFSNIDLDHLIRFLPSNDLSREVLLNRIVGRCNYLGVNLKISGLNKKFHLEFNLSNVDNNDNTKSSILSSPSEFYTNLYVYLSNTINSIAQCQKNEIEEHKILNYNYNKNRQNDVQQIVKRMDLFEKQLEAKEDHDQQEYERIEMEKRQQQEEIKERHLREEKLVKESKKDEHYNMVREVMEKKQADEMKARIIGTSKAKSNITSGNVSSIEQIREIQEAEELKQAEDLIQRARKAENDISYLSRQMFKDHNPILTTHQIKERATMPTVFKEIHAVKIELNNRKNEELMKMHSIFASAIEGLSDEASKIKDMRQNKFDKLLKQHNAKRTEIEDAEKEEQRLKYEAEEKQRQIEEKMAKTMVQSRSTGQYTASRGNFDGKSSFSSSTRFNNPNSSFNSDWRSSNNSFFTRK